MANNNNVEQDMTTLLSKEGEERDQPTAKRLKLSTPDTEVCALDSFDTTKAARNQCNDAKASQQNLFASEPTFHLTATEKCSEHPIDPDVVVNPQIETNGISSLRRTQNPSPPSDDGNRASASRRFLSKNVRLISAQKCDPPPPSIKGSIIYSIGRSHGILSSTCSSTSDASISAGGGEMMINNDALNILASVIELRIRLIIQEAVKFSRHFVSSRGFHACGTNGVFECTKKAMRRLSKGKKAKIAILSPPILLSSADIIAAMNLLKMDVVSHYQTNMLKYSPLSIDLKSSIKSSNVVGGENGELFPNVIGSPHLFSSLDSTSCLGSLVIKTSDFAQTPLQLKKDIPKLRIHWLCITGILLTSELHPSSLSSSLLLSSINPPSISDTSVLTIPSITFNGSSSSAAQSKQSLPKLVVVNPNLKAFRPATKLASHSASSLSPPRDSYYSLESWRGVKLVSQVHSLSNQLSREHLMVLDRVKLSIRDAFDDPTKEYAEPLTKALYSVKTAPGLGQLVPYFIYFGTSEIHSSVSADVPLSAIRVLIRFLMALVKNPNIKVHFYLHQIVQCFQLVVLHPLLGGTKPSVGESTALRQFAAGALAHLVFHFSSIPDGSTAVAELVLSFYFKVLKDFNQPLPSILGAVIGLRSLGHKAVQTVLLPIVPFYIKMLLLCFGNNTRTTEGDRTSMTEITSIPSAKNRHEINSSITSTVESLFSVLIMELLSCIADSIAPKANSPSLTAASLASLNSSRYQYPPSFNNCNLGVGRLGPDEMLADSFEVLWKCMGDAVTPFFEAGAARRDSDVTKRIRESSLRNKRGVGVAIGDQTLTSDLVGGNENEFCYSMMNEYNI